MAGGFPNVKHLWIQDNSGVGDPAAVSESTPEYPGSVGKVGQIKESAGVRSKVLQYVKRESTDTTVAAAAGALAYWADGGDDDFIVVADQSRAEGGSTAPVVAGVFLGTLPSAGSYGYIQVAGTASLLCDGVQTADIVSGNALYPATADLDGKVSHPSFTATAGETDASTIAAAIISWQSSVALPPVGIALAAQADSSGSVAALLTLPRNGW